MGKECMNEGKPLLVVFAGPNGSGKSTITSFFGELQGYTNADEVVKNTDMTNREAAEYVNTKRYESIQARQDFSFETVLSSEYSLEILRKAHREGYFIKCIFVLTANPVLNLLRIRARVEQGGHDVPTDKVVERYKKSLANIKELRQLCDILHIYDNTGDHPWRIFRKHKEEPLKVFPNEYWDEERIIDLVL